MPQYVSRAGQVMTKEEWQQAYADPGVRQVRREEVRHGRGVVETTWVGWCFDRERPPLPFLVERLRAGEPSLDSWHATEAEALARHEELAGGGKG